MENISRIFQNNSNNNKKKHKQIKTKRYCEIASLITQFKIEFLLSFTGFRKVLGKMPALDTLE